MGQVGVHRKNEVNFSGLLEEFEESLNDENGAIGSFIGLVRGTGKKGGEVKKLHYEASDRTEEELMNIVNESEKMNGVSRVSIHHIVDDLEPGDEILYVLVGGGHRGAVFEALPKIMNRLKSEVEIWKKEITEDDEYWLHEIED